VHKPNPLVGEIRQPPNIVAAKYVIPLSSKAVNKVMVPTTSTKEPITESAHV